MQNTLPTPANQQAELPEEVGSQPAISANQPGEKIVRLQINKGLIRFLVVGGLFLLLGCIIIFALSRQQNITVPVVKPTPSSMLVQPEQVTETLSASNVEATPVSVDMVGIDVQWQDAELSYDVQQVYALGDLSPQIISELPPEQQLIVFAIQATDTRTFGAARVVPARSYVNIRRQSQDFPPLGEDSLQLEPGQSTTLYVPFAVPKTELQVLGLLGNLRNPYVVELDFATASQLEGSFDLFNGFQPVGSESAQPSSSAPAAVTSPAAQPTDTPAATPPN